MNRSWWTISITGYGSFQVFATKAEAKEVKDAKSEWEGGRGRMRTATPEEIVEAITHLRWKQEQQYGLNDAEKEALVASQ